MTFRRRVRTIYFKELADILRDRRTLIAMIVVPIVLYPLLMLGSVQAVSYQHESLEQVKLSIGVTRANQGFLLSTLIDADARALRREHEAAESTGERSAPPVEGFTNAEIRLFNSIEEMQDAIRGREVPVGVVFKGDELVDRVDEQLEVVVHADYEEPRGQSAGRRVQELIARTNERLRNSRLSQLNLTEAFVKPYVVEEIDLSAPSSILGEVLPLILILMTITGAIYPAIDLTAGERERGTLESLMVCPVPVLDLIFGKFLVVTTVAIVGAALNLGSVSATVYFGGFDKVIAGRGGGLPVGTMFFLLVALVPFAVFMSAIMIAVCSYARTFKEAQNYVTPVILAVLIPGGAAALPASRLEGVMLVMPVGNMVMLAKELLLGASVTAWQVAMVMLSTTLYAGAAVAVAAKTFGQESVVFADAGSLKAVFSRKLIRPAALPTMTMSLLLTALWFPLWFFVQSALSPQPGESAVGILEGTAWLMPLLFVVLPILVLKYWKIGIAGAFALRRPRWTHLLAGVLVGVSAWIPAQELNVFQQELIRVPEAFLRNAQQIKEAIELLPWPMVILFLAVVPAVCEELLFRGFLLSGLSTASKKWTAILVSATFFAVFHFILFRFAVAGALGVVLGYLCWQSRSILPGMLAHAIHNTIGVGSILYPTWPQWIGVPETAPDAEPSLHLPVHVLLVGLAVFAFALFLASRPGSTSVQKNLSRIEPLP